MTMSTSSGIKPNTSSKERAGWKQKKLLICSICLIVIGSGWYASHAIRKHLKLQRIDALANNPTALAEAIQSKKLSPQDAYAVIAKSQENLSAAGDKGLDDYFALAPADRAKRIDTYIDQMNLPNIQAYVNQNRPPNMPALNNAPGIQLMVGTPFHNVSPEQTAHAAQFSADLIKRLKERGFAATLLPM